MNHEQWWGCYEDGWKGLIVDDAFAHPAKMARGLVYRIVREGLVRGYWDKRTVILDCFGGVGTTGIACSAHGIASLSVELESKFQRMAAGYDCPGVTKQEWVRFHARKRQARNPGDRFCPTCLGDFLGMAVTTRTIPNKEAHHYVGNFDLHEREWTAMGFPSRQRR